MRAGPWKRAIEAAKNQWAELPPERRVVPLEMRELHTWKAPSDKPLKGVKKPEPGSPFELKPKLDRLHEYAWGIIANAGGGDWKKETDEWQEAAVKWRDEYCSRARSADSVAPLTAWSEMPPEKAGNRHE